MKRFFVVVGCIIVSFVIIVLAGLVIASAVRTQAKIDGIMAPFEKAISDVEKVK